MVSTHVCQQVALIQLTTKISLRASPMYVKPRSTQLAATSGMGRVQTWGCSTRNTSPTSKLRRQSRIEDRPNCCGASNISISVVVDARTLQECSTHVQGLHIPRWISFELAIDRLAQARLERLAPSRHALRVDSRPSSFEPNFATA